MEKLKSRLKPLATGLYFLLLSTALFINHPSWAQEAAKPPTPTPPTSPLLQTTLSLLLVLGLLFAVAWYLKRIGILSKQRRGGFYKVIATSALGPREKIVLIEVGDTWLVLGMTANSINTLHSMPAGSINLQETHNPAANFAKMLERIKTGKVKP